MSESITALIYVILACLLVGGIFFINAYTLECQYIACNKNTLRIEKSYLENGKVIYYLRHKTRLFWIGPYIWEYYEEIYDGNFHSHINFSWFECFGDAFLTYEDVKQEYDYLVNYGAKIINTEIIDNPS